MEAEQARRRSTARLSAFQPYPKQVEFYAAGRWAKERMLSAGNQQGKTTAGGAEVAYHLTGRYPSWWPGRTYEQATRAWAAGVTNESTRDTVQRMLLGPPAQAELRGTGMIPKDAIVDVTPARGTPDLVDTIVVRHGGGGDVQAQQSALLLKSYERGREKWQGDTLDFVWLDEEPPEDIYTEAMARLIASGGLSFLTFTPLKGMSTIAARFFLLDPESPEASYRKLIQMTDADAPHITPERLAEMLAIIPAHEREARIKGVPVMGSGRVFPVPEASISWDGAYIDPSWARIGALDFGWDHPTAAVELLWDREADIVYVNRAYRQREATPATHSVALLAWGDRLPWAWPHDGLAHDKGSGETLAGLYRHAGLKLLPLHAQFSDGGNGVEAGLMEMLTRMQTGRLRVRADLADWWEEFRLYHRDQGRVVKLRDDLMSATRYGLMMLRCAEVVSDVSAAPAPRRRSGGSWMG
jgi:phage terminase large subunit-like protein